LEGQFQQKDSEGDNLVGNVLGEGRLVEDDEHEGVEDPGAEDDGGALVGRVARRRGAEGRPRTANAFVLVGVFHAANTKIFKLSEKTKHLRRSLCI